MLLLSRKIAPGLLVALHLKVSTLSFLLMSPVLTLIFITCPFWKLFLKKALELYFKERGFSKSEDSSVNCELEVVTLFFRKKFMIYDFWLMEESSIDFFS